MEYPTAAELWKAQEMFEKDARARALAMSCVAYAMQEYGPIDPERADRAAHDIASLATNLLCSRFYLGDTELRELKEENERLKELAFDTIMTKPPKLVVPSPQAGMREALERLVEACEARRVEEFDPASRVTVLETRTKDILDFHNALDQAIAALSTAPIPMSEDVK